MATSQSPKHIPDALDAQYDECSVTSVSSRQAVDGEISSLGKLHRAHDALREAQQSLASLRSSIDVLLPKMSSMAPIDELCAAIEMRIQAALSIIREESDVTSSAGGGTITSWYNPPRSLATPVDAFESSRRTAPSLTTQMSLTDRRATFDSCEDGIMSQWLNENFTQAGRKKRTGFDVVHPSLPPQPPHPSAIAPTSDHPLSNNVPASAPFAQPQLNATASREESLGVVVEVHQKVQAAKEVTFTRTTTRGYSAANSNISTATILKRNHCPMIVDIDSPDWDIFDAYAKHKEELLVVVAGNIFARYTFMPSMRLNIPKFFNFVREIRKYYRDENPYHNHIHAADVLQTTHVFLCVNDMRENFSDVELLAVLFTAMVHDAGHMGVSNAFLSKVRHPISRVYNDLSNLESGHSALAFSVMEHPECNFFAPESCFTREMFDDFRSLVVDSLMGTDMKVHADHTRAMQGMLVDGVVDDPEIPKLLRSIVHVADISNPMKPLHVYQQWVQLVFAEFWQQGDEERRRGMPISMLCDRHTATVGKSQYGFINFVIHPFIKEMSEMMPSLWMDRLTENGAFMEKISLEEETAILDAVSKRIDNTPWRDVDPKHPYTMLAALQRLVTLPAYDSSILDPHQFPELTAPQRGGGVGADDLDPLKQLTTSSSAANSHMVPTPPTASGGSSPKVMALLRMPHSATLPLDGQSFGGSNTTPRGTMFSARRYQAECSRNLESMPTPQWMKPFGQPLPPPSPHAE